MQLRTFIFLKPDLYLGIDRFKSQLREIVFLAEMSQDNMRNVIDRLMTKSCDQLCATVIGQMPFLTLDSFLEGIGIASCLKHMYIMIRFQIKDVRIQQFLYDTIVKVSEVCCRSDLFPSGLEAISHRICGIVRNRKRRDQNVPYHKRITRNYIVK